LTAILNVLTTLLPLSIIVLLFCIGGFMVATYYLFRVSSAQILNENERILYGPLCSEYKYERRMTCCLMYGFKVIEAIAFGGVQCCGWVQVGLLLSVPVIQMIYIVVTRPFKNASSNWIQLFFCLIKIFQCVVFGFYAGGMTDSTLGEAQIGLNIAIGILYLIRTLLRIIRNYCIRRDKQNIPPVSVPVAGITNNNSVMTVTT